LNIEASFLKKLAVSYLTKNGFFTLLKSDRGLQFFEEKL